MYKLRPCRAARSAVDIDAHVQRLDVAKVACSHVPVSAEQHGRRVDLLWRRDVDCRTHKDSAAAGYNEQSRQQVCYHPLLSMRLYPHFPPQMPMRPPHPLCHPHRPHCMSPHPHSPLQQALHTPLQQAMLGTPTHSLTTTAMIPLQHGQQNPLRVGPQSIISLLHGQQHPLEVGSHSMPNSGLTWVSQALSSPPFRPLRVGTHSACCPHRRSAICMSPHQGSLHGQTPCQTLAQRAEAGMQQIKPPATT